MKKSGGFLAVLFFLFTAAVFADDILFFPPIVFQSPFPYFAPKARLTIGYYEISNIVVNRTSDQFYISLGSNKASEASGGERYASELGIHKVLFQALNDFGFPIYSDMIDNPPFETVWTQQPEPWRITQMRYKLYYKGGKIIEGTFSFLKQPKYFTVPMPAIIPPVPR